MTASRWNEYHVLLSVICGLGTAVLLSTATDRSLAFMKSIGSDAEPRNRVGQACEHCRALKVKCRPSNNDERGVCQKCLRETIECIYLERQPRRSLGALAKRDGKSRVNQLESKVDELHALLVQTQVIQEVPGGSDTVIVQQFNDESLFPSTGGLEQSQENDVEGESIERYNIQTIEDWATFGPIANDIDVFPDRLSPGVLTFDRADMHVKKYASMFPFYPFVAIHSHMRAEEVSRERPFLFLAILTATSSTEKYLQRALDEEFRSTLSRMVIIEGKKSLDILQGLLVYLAWYQFHYEPRTQQLYQFLQIAIGLVIDLGLDQEPWKTKAKGVGLHSSHYEEGLISVNGDDFYSQDARRAYLGCYYLSTAISCSIFKPNNLKHSAYMTRCAMSPAADIEVPTDSSIQYLVPLSHLRQNIYDIYHPETTDSQPDLNQARLQTHVKNFQQDLEAWKAFVPRDYQQFPIIIAGYHAANIAVHEMGLVYGIHLRNTNTDTPDFSTSTACITTLTTCLESTISFLENFLSVPPSEFRNFSLIDWAHLTHAIFILYKLSLGISTVPEWNVQVARNKIKLEDYLTEISQRMRSIDIEAEREHHSSKDLFSMFPIILQNIVDAYLRVKDDPESGKTDDEIPHRAFTRDGKRGSCQKILSRRSDYGRCPALACWSDDGTSDQDQNVADVDNGSSSLDKQPFSNQALVPNEDQEPWDGMMVDFSPLSDLME